MNTIRYKIAGISETEVVVEAEVAGVGMVQAKVPVTAIECVSEDGSMGHTFRIHGPNDGTYNIGDDVDVTIAVVA
jgi:hypothetical protein